jgi:hypothetical protein
MKREFIIQGFPICVALIFFVLTSGCVSITPKKSYSGDKLPKSEVAVIKGWYYFSLLNSEAVIINNIDGKYLGPTNEFQILFLPGPGATKVEVLPGWHELLIVHDTTGWLSGSRECVRAAFNFEAGHEYKIKTPFIGDWIKMMDVNTGVTIFSEIWGSCRSQLIIFNP